MRRRDLAEEFFTICVRALDYTAPVDITFGSYLRSIMTADFDLHPRDEMGMRDAMHAVVPAARHPPRGGGLLQRGSGVCWPRAPEELPPVVGLDFGDPNGLTKTAEGQRRRSAARLHRRRTASCSASRTTTDPRPLVPSRLPHQSRRQPAHGHGGAGGADRPEELQRLGAAVRHVPAARRRGADHPQADRRRERMRQERGAGSAT